MSDTIYLFDGSAYIFRAFYATPRLTNDDGLPTNALFGFTRMCLKFLRETSPAHALMVFDAGKETFRNELYPEYKANRDECPEDLLVQMPHFRTISRALGFPVVELPGFEADDVIGTITTAAKALDKDVVIVSADKDLMQLVNGQVSMWDTMRDKRYDSAGVKEKLGVLPEQVIDYLAIAGDSSDNIPGLKGAGPKTAIQLLERYGDVEKILTSADEIREDKAIRSRKKIAEQIEVGGELLELSKQLVTIKRDAPIEFSDGRLFEISDEHGVSEPEDFLAELAFHGPQREALEEVVEQFGFESLITEYDLSGEKKEESSIARDYHLVLKKDFEAWKKELLSQKEFAFDLETTALNVHAAEIVGFACSWGDDKTFYVPCAHKEKAGEQIAAAELLEAIRQCLEDPEIKKIGQNLKYDSEVLRTHGVTLRGVHFDTMVAAYLLHPDTGGYGLSKLAKDHLNHRMIEYDEVVPDGENFQAVSLEDALNYAGEDAHVAWLLYQDLSPLIESAELEQVCYELESPLVEVLSAIEHVGIRLDVDFLKGMSEEISVELERLEKEIYEAAGEEFNINSPKQIGQILFEKIGISTKGVKKTKTGYSTNQAVLEKLRDEHPVPSLILDYRGLHKLRSTYLESLPREVSEYTGRLHTKLNQTIAATGRLSSSEPNLQNIPIQTELGRKVRNAFVPSDGKLFIAADYSQIELRLLAHLSGDEVLTEAFVQGLDIHERTAREVLGIGPIEQVTPEERRIGKTMNFGIVYGMSGFRLGKELGIPVSEGNAYIETYFARYPKVQEYFDSLEDKLESDGEVRTILGRRRIISEIEQGARDSGFVKRAALNAPLQGSAADLIKLAMIQMHSVIEKENLPLTMVLQVHDELLFEVERESAKELSERVKSEMEGIMELSVPLLVDVALGENWGEAHS